MEDDGLINTGNLNDLPDQIFETSPGSIIDIFHAQICYGDFAIRIQCYYNILLQLVYKHSCCFSCLPWLDSSSCKYCCRKLYKQHVSGQVMSNKTHT